MKTMTKETWWLATGLLLVAFALIFAGVWLKFGGELAMIAGGFMLFWFAGHAFADND